MRPWKISFHENYSTISIISILIGYPRCQPSHFKICFSNQMLLCILANVDLSVSIILSRITIMLDISLNSFALYIAFAVLSKVLFLLYAVLEFLRHYILYICLILSQNLHPPSLGMSLLLQYCNYSSIPGRLIWFYAFLLIVIISLFNKYLILTCSVCNYYTFDG